MTPPAPARKLASRQKTSNPGRSIFVHGPQTRATPQGKAAWYDETASGGLLGGINLYGYANQNPLTYVDPNGLAGVLPGPVPLPVPGPVTPGYGSGGSRGDDFGGLFPGMGGKDSGALFRTPRWPSWPGDDSGSDGEAWPKENKDFCIRTYANCKNYGWTGSCNACLDLCLGSGSGDWPFHMCKPKKKKDRCE